MTLIESAIYKGPFYKSMKRGFPLQPTSDGSSEVEVTTSIMEVHFVSYLWLIKNLVFGFVNLFQFTLVLSKGMLYVKIHFATTIP